MSDPFQLLPAPDALLSSVPQLSDFSKAAARVELPPADVLEELALASGPLDRPVAMFVDRSDEQLTRTAIEAGAQRR